jgi:hypothetical protein
MDKKLAIALVHYPILDRQQKEVATSITNFDIHDIGRAARTYGADKYYIIHPAREQLMFVSRVLDHWKVGKGQAYNPMRKTALTEIEPIESLEKAIAHWNQKDLQIIATSAKDSPETPQKTFRQVRESLAEKNTLLLFGTGFGLSPQILKECDSCIEPIRGYGEEDYRHLSVRSAVSIVLDRLRGSW